jgi:hypothetical protein
MFVYACCSKLFQACLTLAVAGYFLDPVNYEITFSHTFATKILSRLVGHEGGGA